MKPESKRTILIAGMGTTPAVLTNAVWALAHQKKPVVPDEIVAFITKNGKTLLKKELFDGGVWADMLKCLAREGIDVGGKLMFGETSIRSIPDAKGNEIDDLRTGEDNLRAADFMLSQLRQYTEDGGTELHVSIAGGRKTMSALLFSCMTLLGRECDKVYHVLLPQAIEFGSTPSFYYPKRGATYTARSTGKKHKAKDLQSELFEVPFVRMRGWYHDKFKTIPPSYRTLVSKVQTVAPPAVTIPRIEIDAWNASVLINGVAVRPGANEFAALLVLASGIGNVEEIYNRLNRLKHQSETGWCDWIGKFVSQAKYAHPYVEDEKQANQEVSKTLSRLRKLIESKGLERLESLIPQRGRGVTYPVSQITWRGKGKLMDICGYLFSPIGKEDVL